MRVDGSGPGLEVSQPTDTTYTLSSTIFQKKSRHWKKGAGVVI
jgi:hypothetical protein